MNSTLVANVYPQVWTQYTITFSGLPAPTSGRLAFRYFVTNGGPSGANSDYIGVDNVVYTPYVCPVLSLSPTSLPNANWGGPYSQSLSQIGALGAPSYAITAGQLPPSLTLRNADAISGTPVSTDTFNFTSTVSDNSGCSGSASYAITVNAVAPSAPLNVVASAGDAQVVVSWDPPTSDGGAGGIFDYNVECGSNLVIASSSPITFTNLVNGTPYICSGCQRCGRKRTSLQ